MKKCSHIHNLTTLSNIAALYIALCMHVYTRYTHTVLFIPCAAPISAPSPCSHRGLLGSTPPRHTAARFRTPRARPSSYPVEDEGGETGPGKGAYVNEYTAVRVCMRERNRERERGGERETDYECGARFCQPPLNFNKRVNKPLHSLRSPAPSNFNLVAVTRLRRHGAYLHVLVALAPVTPHRHFSLW